MLYKKSVSFVLVQVLKRMAAVVAANGIFASTVITVLVRVRVLKGWLKNYGTLIFGNDRP